MKYWNKDKRIREAHWHRVKLMSWNYSDLKLELQRFDSPGKFYLYYAGTYVWFEREQDAVWFSLKQV